MRADTQAITTKAAPDAVLGFVADGANLPRWAIGFAKSVARSGDAWIVTTGQGIVPTTIRCNYEVATIDFCMDMGPGAQSAAYTRVMPNDAGADLVFTQFQGADVPDDVFDQLVAAVGHELTALKAILEVECPL